MKRGCDTLAREKGEEECDEDGSFRGSDVRW